MDFHGRNVREQLEVCILNRQLYRTGNLTLEDFAARMDSAFELIEHGTAPNGHSLHGLNGLAALAWESIMDASWLVTDLLPAEPSLIVLYGPSGSFKSFLACDLSLAMATCQRFLPPSTTEQKWGGFEGFEVPRPARILYVAAEDAAARIKKRLAELRAFRSIDGPTNHGGAFEIHVVHWPNERRPILLSHLPHRVEIARKAAGEGYQLVVFDTLAECVRGVEENSAKEMSQVVDWANEIRAAGASVVLIHHSRKAPPPSAQGQTPVDLTDPANMRGSSALHGAADILIASSTWGEPDSDQIRVRISKSRVMERAGMRDMIVEVASEPEPEYPSKFCYSGDYEGLNVARKKAKEERIGLVQHAVFELFHTGKESTSDAVAEKVEMPRRTIQRILHELVKRGVVSARKVAAKRGLMLVYEPPRTE